MAKSAKERVLAVYPRASVGFAGGGAMIFDGNGDSTIVGRGTSSYSAWRDAASRLPSPQVEGATQTANGWIDMVIGWNERGQMDKDAVREALYQAKDAMKAALRDDNKEAKHG